jgi:hypothetical protein
MIRHKTWRSLVVGGIFLAVLALHAAGTVGQTGVPDPSSPPTSAIPLRDGSTAMVWWDAVSDQAHPGWRCEVPAPRGEGAGRTTSALTAAGDWRAALAEARAVLKGRVADGD